MAREYERPACRRVLRAEGLDEGGPVPVERRGRLVEHPEDRIVEEEPRERGAAPLTRGELAGEGPAFRGEPHPLQRLFRAARRPSALERAGEAQVLERS